MNEFECNSKQTRRRSFDVNYEDLNNIADEKLILKNNRPKSLFIDNSYEFNDETYILKQSNKNNKKIKNTNKCLKNFNDFCKSKWSHYVHNTTTTNNKLNKNIVSIKKFNFKTPSFYFSNINREQAEVLLCGQENGVFLLRDSIHYKGQLILSLAYNSKFEHYVIIRSKSNNYVSLDEIEWFYTIQDLIKYYQLEQGGLCTKLTIGLSSEFLAYKFYDNIDLSRIIQLNQIKFKEHIGSGEFGIVRRGTWANKEVAIKQIKDLSLIESFLNEANIMSNLSHRNLIELYGITIECTLLLITDYMSKGCLLNYLQSRGRNVIDANELVKYAYDISCGMAYLEKNKISHCDLCTSNILLNDDNTAKICDFGLAKYYKDLKKTKISKIRIRWTAPEVLLDKHFNEKSDSWSFGIVLYELFSYGRTPYPNIKLNDVQDYVQSGERMSAPDLCPKQIYDIMCVCWSIKPKLRPKFDYLVKQFYNFSSHYNFNVNNKNSM